MSVGRVSGTNTRSVRCGIKNCNCYNYHADTSSFVLAVTTVNIMQDILLMILTEIQTLTPLHVAHFLNSL